MRLVLFHILWFLTIPLFLTAATEKSSPEPFRIYLIADFTNTGVASESIAKGIRVALAMNDFRAGGHPVELIRKDYGGNSIRYREYLEEFVRDPRALAAFSGLHSSPIIANADYIIKNQILTMVPWAAATGVTRHPSPDNCIFRLSCDDSISGEVMVRYAIDARHLKRPALLLEQSVWGKANAETLQQALKQRGIVPASVAWFNWGISEAAARIILRNLIMSGADSIIMIANVAEGEAFCLAMASLPPQQRKPIISHWGITGADFPRVVTPDIRQNIDLVFIQTTFSFFQPSIAGQQVLATAARLFPREIRTAVDIPVSGGMVNAYDLTQILLAAINQTTLTSSPEANRRSLCQSLENIRQPVPGLIKTYIQPFRRHVVPADNSHEALRLEDFTMGYYAPDNTIRLLPLISPAGVK